MAQWEDRSWESSFASGLPRRDRASGAYRAYVPDPLVTRPLVIAPDTALRIAEVERMLCQLANDPASGPLEGISRLLLRSEAIASSRIEGIAPSAGKVVLAELAQTESVRGVSEAARSVAANIAALSQASGELARVDAVSVADIGSLHRALLPEHPDLGIRTSQNWIGGSSYGPIDAEFVPPPPEQVPALLDDLVRYLNGGAHSALVQAALIHAQFETIHPFGDGNGRVGRALVHTVLTRRGITRGPLLPISLVLSTLRDAYVDGLTEFRYDGDMASPQAQAGMNAWITTFVEACASAVEQAERLRRELVDLRAEQLATLITRRTQLGLARPHPRADSATFRILDLLPRWPILTMDTVRRELDVSRPASIKALDELVDAGLLVRKPRDRGRRAYVCDDILDLLAISHRRLASDRFDAKVAPPNRPVPALPEKYRQSL